MAKVLGAIAREYALPILLAAAGSVLLNLFVPLAEVVFKLYYPLGPFVERNVMPLIIIFICNIAMWIALWNKPVLYRFAPYILSFLAVIGAFLMREGILPNNVRVQFNLFAGGMILLCGGIIVHVSRFVYNGAREIYIANKA